MRNMGRAGTSLWRNSMVAGAIILTAVLAGCAPAPTGAPPRVMQPDDLKMLAGAWLGATEIQGEVSVPIQGVIQETGAYYIVPRTGGGQTPGTLKIVDGGVVYESPTSKGKMTFHEYPSQWVWKWDGVTPDGRYVRNELTKSK